MEIHQLKAFLAVARTGQLVRASEQLHLSQSAVSKQIKSFEEELGTMLFDRTTNGTLLTGAGRRLLPLAAKALDVLAEMSALAKSMRGTVSGPLRLGTIIDPESIRLGPLLGALLQFYPHIDVSLRHGISGSVLQMLREREIDACFYLGALHDSDIAVRPLAMEHYVVVGPTGWADALASVDWSGLADMPWIAAQAGSSQHTLVAHMFAEHGLTHRTVVEADQESSMIELVQSGVALGLMRERLALQAVRSGHAVIWHGARVPCALSLAHRREDADSAVVQALLSALQVAWPPESEAGPGRGFDHAG